MARNTVTTVKLYDWQVSALDTLASRRGYPRSFLIREAIKYCFSDPVCFENAVRCRDGENGGRLTVVALKNVGIVPVLRSLRLNNYSCFVRVAVREWLAKFAYDAVRAGSTTVYACPICGRVFSTINQLRKHILEHAEIEKRCPLCGARVNSVTGFKLHLVKKNDDAHKMLYMIVDGSRKVAARLVAPAPLLSSVNRHITITVRIPAALANLADEIGVNRATLARLALEIGTIVAEVAEALSVRLPEDDAEAVAVRVRAAEASLAEMLAGSHDNAVRAGAAAVLAALGKLSDVSLSDIVFGARFTPIVTVYRPSRLPQHIDIHNPLIPALAAVMAAAGRLPSPRTLGTKTTVKPIPVPAAIPELLEEAGIEPSDLGAYTLLALLY